MHGRIRSCSVVAFSALSAVLVLGVARVFAQASGVPSSKPSSPPLRCTVADGFTLAAVGDIIMANPESANDNPQFQAQLKILRSADVVFGNFEDTAIDIRHFHGSPQAENGGAWPIASPLVPADLKKMGFSMVNRANNHATDWGVEGMAETDRRLDEAGIVHAGTGRDLSAARAPQYLETPEGRVALVGIASTFTPMSVAADPAGIIPGRPGIDPLRTTRSILVPDATMQSLVDLHNQLLTPFQHPVSGLPERLNVEGTQYELASHFGVRYQMDPSDVAGILRNIRQGKESSDFLIATIHCHEFGKELTDPPAFLVELAHQAIDNGADAFISQGPHVLRGIEIYKGKPIFYGLGDYFFELHQQQFMLPSVYAALHLDPDTSTVAELENVRASSMFGGSRLFWTSVIAICTYQHGQISEIRLYPVDLGQKRRWSQSGVPWLASPGVSQSVLRDLATLSKPFGTEIEIQGNVGIIRIPTSSAAPGQAVN